MATWAEFERAAPELAEFGAGLLMAPPAYMATVRVEWFSTRAPGDADHRRWPLVRLHGADLAEGARPRRARLVLAAQRRTRHERLRRGVLAHGRGNRVEDVEFRQVAAAASHYTPADRYVLFEFDVHEARCNGYGDVALPDPSRWRDATAVA